MDVHQNAQEYAKPVDADGPFSLDDQGHGGGVGVTAKTVRKWQARHALQGEAGLVDRTSRPRRSPTRLDDAAVACGILGAAPPAPGRTRHRPPARPARLDREPHPASPRARPARRPRPQAHDRPLPARAARRAGPHRHQEAGEDRRYRPSHHRQPRPAGRAASAGDSAGPRRRRLAPSPTPRSCPTSGKRAPWAFLKRALAWFATLGVAVERVMTDNGSAYRSHRFRDACETARVKHKRTRPYTPRTNGKAERFIQTSIREWAYRQAFTSSAQRAADHAPLAARYNSTPTPFSPWRKPTLHPADQGQPPW